MGLHDLSMHFWPLSPLQSGPLPHLNQSGVGGAFNAPPYYLSSCQSQKTKFFCASPLFDNEFPTLSKSRSIFASFTLLFNNLCFQVLFYLKISNGCKFLILEARRTIFTENVYLYVGSRRSAGKRRRIFMKFNLYRHVRKA